FGHRHPLPSCGLTSINQSLTNGSRSASLFTMYPTCLFTVPFLIFLCGDLFLPCLSGISLLICLPPFWIQFFEDKDTFFCRGRLPFIFVSFVLVWRGWHG